MAVKDSTKNTLELVFETDMPGSSGTMKTATITIVDPREDLTKAQVQSVMNTVISNELFQVNGANLTAIKDFYYRLVETKVLA